MMMAFLKFALLATTGEAIGLRISKGHYNEKGFGLLPRAIVWGFLGMGISMAMMVFKTGVPAFLNNMGVDVAASVFAKQPLTSVNFAVSLLIAFCTSVVMNCIFAPVFMTFHKITDMHIIKNGGNLQNFFRHPINMATSFKAINWDIQWGFVFKKTIPFFWFPAHTITFMLPGEFQVLFAALLGVALGLILAVASLKK